MPSHRVHRIVGNIICGFSFKDIDVLIDKRGRHDVGRMDCGELLKQVAKVYSKYGEQGLCYYVLHHYLDKIDSLIKGRCMKLFSRPEYANLPLGERFKYLSREVREGLLDEVSTLSYIDEGWGWPRSLTTSNAFLSLQGMLRILSDPSLNPVIRRYFIYREYVDKGYSKRTAKEKAEARLAVIDSCLDYEHPDLHKLRLQVRRVRSSLVNNLEKVICIMFSMDRRRWLHWLGAEYYDCAVEALNCGKYLEEVNLEDTR